MYQNPQLELNPTRSSQSYATWVLESYNSTEIDMLITFLSLLQRRARGSNHAVPFALGASRIGPRLALQPGLFPGVVWVFVW